MVITNFVLHPLLHMSYFWGVWDKCEAETQRHWWDWTLGICFKVRIGPLIPSLWPFSLFALGLSESPSALQ